MKLPARYGRPELLAEVGWIIEWRIAEHDVPYTSAQIDAMEARVSRELLAPAGHKAAAVALDRIIPGKRLGGRRSDALDDKGWGQLSRNYLEVLGELPADLLPLAIARTLREWCSPELPPPGFIRTRVGEELAERELVGAKLRSMRLKLESDVRLRVRLSASHAADRGLLDRANERAETPVTRLCGVDAGADPTPEEAGAMLERDRAEFLRKLERAGVKEAAG